MKLPVRRRLVVSTVAAVAVVGGGLALLVRHGGSGSTQYRTATATVGTVTQTLALSGNLSPVGESDLDFGSSGKITAVNVQPGQRVTAGEVLATLDFNSLQAALIQAQATLSSAQARVSLDQSGPTAQSLAQSQASVRSAQAQVASAQTALTDGNEVDQAEITAAQKQLSDDTASCKASPAVSTPTPAPSTPTPTPPPTPSPTPAPTPNPACGRTGADQNAIKAAQAKATQDQHQEQNQLTQAQSQLANAQSQLATADQSATATQLAQDQAQVQVDQVNVNNAELALNGATITAPVAGVVGQVNISAGQLTSGGSSSGSGSSNLGGGGGGNGGSNSSSSSGSSATHDIVVLTPGAFQVVGSVSDTQVSEVALGQTAQVSVAGDPNPISGKVTNIAAEPTVTSGVASFPVTVVLSGTNSDLHSGVSASVSLVINQVSDVLTVPTSAVRPAGAGDTVETLVNNQVVDVPVTIGATELAPHPDPVRAQRGPDRGRRHPQQRRPDPERQQLRRLRRRRRRRHRGRRRGRGRWRRPPRHRGRLRPVTRGGSAEPPRPSAARTVASWEAAPPLPPRRPPHVTPNGGTISALPVTTRGETRPMRIAPDPNARWR